MSDNISVIPLEITKSIIDTFRVQLSVKAEVKVETKAASDALVSGPINLDIVSLMGIKSSRFVGSLALGFPLATFLAVLEKMLGERFDAITTENADACSELLNIVYASARMKINEAGFDFQPAIPSTVSGKEVSLPLGQFSSYMHFDGQSEIGPFVMAFSLKRVE